MPTNTPRSIAEALKPCPICGSTARVAQYRNHNDWWWQGSCLADTCRVMGPIRDTEAEAADAWNRRALATANGAEVGLPEPLLFTHELLEADGKGKGVHLGCAVRGMCEQAYDEGETSREVSEWYTAAQLRAYAELCSRGEDGRGRFGAALAELVFDGNAVLAAVPERERKYVSVESLGAVLDALARAARKQENDHER